MSGRDSKGRPPLVLAKLWAKTSGKGNRYLSGRLGAARILIMQNRDKQGDDDPTHLLLLAEITEPSSRGGGSR
jgi:hypothetical protein